MNLNHLLEMKICVLYDIENELIKGLPKLAKSATDMELKQALTDHFEETKRHVERLEEVFRALAMKPKKLKSAGIRGILDDAVWVTKNISGSTALDANIAAAAQYAEHYEMAGYGAAIEWARLLGNDVVSDLLQETLEEEEAASDTLTQLSATKLDQEALGSDENTEKS